MEWKRPVAVRGLDDGQLEHMIEFSLCHLKAIRTQATTAAMDRISVANVVGDCVFHGDIMVIRTRKFRKACQKSGICI